MSTRVNKERLCRMIALARFEKKNEDKALRINNSYEQDYVARAMIRNFLLTSLAYVLVVAVIAMFNMDVLLSNLSNLNLRPLIVILLISYLIMIGVFSVIAYVMARLRYGRMSTGIRQYRYELEQLRKSYRAEDILLRRKANGDEQEDEEE